MSNEKFQSKGVFPSADLRWRKREISLQFLAKFKPLNTQTGEYERKNPKFARLHFNSSHSVEVSNSKEMRIVMALRDALKEKKENSIGLIKFWQLENSGLPHHETFKTIEKLVRQGTLFKESAASLKGYFRYGICIDQR